MWAKASETTGQFTEHRQHRAELLEARLAEHYHAAAGTTVGR